MTCTECGEKAKDDSKHFTKTVVEINNPEKRVLMRKVVVPASMGTEEEYPASVGKFFNVLLAYEANGHIYLYSSDGIPTMLSTDVGDLADKLEDLRIVVTDEITAREEGDASLSSQINSLSTSLSSETAARELADQTLQNSIDTLDGSLATVAKTGSYTNLSNKPTIGDGTITFTENNVVKGTFSANATENKTIEFPVPTQTSELTNNGSDGTSVYVEADELPTVDTTYNSTSGNAIANSTVTNSLDRDVMTNLALDANPSTTTINLNNTKTNLAAPSSTTTNSISLPVASSTQAGVMNAAMYDTLTKNTQDIANIVGEVVAISNLPASPTQAQLTNAWLNASGQSALINGAGVYDVTNAKRWTYYSNDTTWHALDASGSVTVNTWSNTAAGIVKGSTNVGQIFAENDGTGSVNGWDTLTATVGNHTSKLATIEQGAEVNVQADWDETVTTADDYIKNKPQNLVQDAAYVHTDNNFTTPLKNKLNGMTVNDATLTIQNDGVDVETFTANSATNKTANIVPPVKIGSVVSQPSSVAYVGTNNIIDGAVTSNKIDSTTFPSVVITPTATSNINLTATNQTIMTYSVTIPGKYLVLVDCYAANDSEIDIDLNLDSTNLIGTATTKAGYGPLNLTYLATVTTGQSLNVVARGSGTIFAVGTRTHMVIARLI